MFLAYKSPAGTTLEAQGPATCLPAFLPTYLPSLPRLPARPHRPISLSLPHPRSLVRPWPLCNARMPFSYFLRALTYLISLCAEPTLNAPPVHHGVFPSFTCRRGYEVSMMRPPADECMAGERWPCLRRPQLLHSFWDTHALQRPSRRKGTWGIGCMICPHCLPSYRWPPVYLLPVNNSC